MKKSDINHLRRLLGWVRCEIGQAPDDMVATVQDIGAKLGAVPMSNEAMGRMVAAHDAARRVPAYIRAAIKALEQATFSGAVVDSGRPKVCDSVQVVGESQTCGAHDDLVWCACGDGYPAASFDAGIMSALGHCSNCDTADKPSVPERRPLTGEEIEQWWASENGLEDCNMCRGNDFQQVVRAVEAAHGITGDGQ